MHLMRESWTDARLDDFAANVDKRFDAVDKRFDAVDRRFDSVDRRLGAVEAELKALNRTLLQVGGGIIATFIAGIFGVIATQF